MMRTLLLLAAPFVFVPLLAAAADVPKPTAQDARVRVVTYDPKQVTVIKVARGVVTRVILAPDEAIQTAVTGLSARCGDENDEWCIQADKGGNQIFVRPKDNADQTNLELRTNKRDYSFMFSVSRIGTAESFYRVIFEYPQPKVDLSLAPLQAVLDAPVGTGRTLPGEPGYRPAAAAGVASPAVSAPAVSTPSQRLRREVPQPRNTNYTMQVMEGGEDAAPSMVFDDGRFTYFEYLGTREIPAIFVHTADPDPSRVNWHMEPPYVVVERTGRRFTLRLGKAVVGVFNESFDAVGVDTPSFTVSPEVERYVKEPGRE